MINDMELFITYILYTVWLLFGYLVFGIPGIFLGFVIVFVILRSCSKMLERDIFDGLTNSGRDNRTTPKKEVFNKNSFDDDWDD